MTDRELDQEIGEKVLGLWVYHYDKGASPASEYWALMDADLNPVGPITREGLPHRRTEAEAWEDLPYFSTDIGAAWQVVEAVQELGFGFGIWSVGRIWVANFEQGTRHEYEADGELPAEAICRAALKVVEAGYFTGEEEPYA